jgi:uncharacterized protein
MREEAILQRIRRLVESGEIDGVVAVYLFGSHARGTAHSESDIDLAVLLDRQIHPQSEQRFEQRLRWIALLGSPERPAIDVVILNDVPPLLGRAIVTKGKLLYCSDPEQNHASVRDILLMAADLEPFIERMRRIKLEALSR